MSPNSRSNLSPPDVNGRSREGRTPPPAPSAAFARRTRAIIEDETGMSPIKPSATLATEEDERVSVDSAYSGGYRRQRAGTMPSNLETPQRYLVPDDATPTPLAYSAEITTPVRTSALSPVYPMTTSARPALRHTTSSSANLETPTANRIRSGSLTLPQPGLSGAFGGSPFGQSLFNNPGLGSAPAKSPLGFPIQGKDEDPLDFTSPSDSSAPLVTDDNLTLDYLGLGGNDLPPASMTELRNQAQRAIANSGPASRLRASTVSFARPFRPSVTANSGYGGDQGLYGGPVDEDALAREIANLGMKDNGLAIDNHLANLYAPSNMYMRDNNRPRATTIGALDNPMRRSGNRNYLASIPQSPVVANLANPQMTNGSYGYAPRSRSDRDLTRSRESSISRGPRLSISSHTSRAGTPDFDRGSSTPQIPTRSLWIGNLDVNATSEALLHVFAPYGPIESVRLLPEKTCAFVNFMDKKDAIQARDAVLNRLGGQVPSLSETAPVRIGFGKIDSAPVGPMVTAITAPPTGLVFTNANPTAVTVPPVPISAVPTTPDLNGDLSSLPTRALWIGSIPGTTSSATLLQIFSPFGDVESARVLMQKCCGFVNFEHLDSAVSARSALNGRDILGSDVGPIRIGFARVPNRSPLIGGPVQNSGFPSPSKELTNGLSAVKGATSVSTEQQLSVEGGGVENYRSQLVLDLVKQGVHEQVLEKGLGREGSVSEQQMIMQVLSAGRAEDGDVKAAADVRPPVTYYTSIPIITDRPIRRFDSTKLKELRRRLDTGTCSQGEIDEFTLDIMDECAELASDYIGNTVVQKLFERASFQLRRAMLDRIVPHLAMIGIHKNGTWAAQKVIECSTTSEERDLIVAHIRPFAPTLMCDSLGNYVCAGTLRFGAPWNEYVYDAMVDRLWEIAQNRFGARCMRTCLESAYTTLYQKKRIATGIILNSIPLATNPNGALLLTWLVDQSNLPARYGLLANRFIPHIAHLCTHKLASLTILRIITQTAEPSAASHLINSIFTSAQDQTLTEILSDVKNGAQVIGKILAISSLRGEDREMMVTAVRRGLPHIKASTTPPYRMLLEAVGLPVPAGPTPFGRPPQWARPPPPPQQHQQHQQQQFGYYPYQPASPHLYHQPMGGTNQNLSPLLIPQNMPLGQAMRNGSPGLGGSPRTPVQRHRGRLSPGSQMMSPGSDPFNPFASPSVDLPYNQIHHPNMRLSSQLGRPPMNFAPQPNIGGLGFMEEQSGQGYGQQQEMFRSGMYAGANFQN